MASQPRETSSAHLNATAEEVQGTAVKSGEDAAPLDYLNLVRSCLFLLGRSTLWPLSLIVSGSNPAL